MVKWIFVALVASAGSVQAASLAELLEAAWARRPEAQSLQARRLEARESGAPAESLLAGAPALGLSTRNDRLTENRGKLEYEVEVSAPLWLPGEREARRTLASAEVALPDAAAAVARLGLAGDLRRIVWLALAARADTALIRARREAAEALAADVERRARAGELARADALLARADALRVQGLQVAAEGRLQNALAQLRLLTGAERLPEPAEEPLRDAAPAQEDPRLAAAAAAIERARAQSGLTALATRASPEFGVQFRRDRDRSGVEANDSLSFQLRIPFATEARNRPLRAAAEARLTEAMVEARYRRSALDAAAQAASLELENARRALPPADARREATREAERLARQAFRLGETSLAELLRTTAIAADAEGDALAARLAVSRAIAMLNQARGWMP